MRIIYIPEAGFKDTFSRISKLVDPHRGPILEIYKNPRYNDEPLLYQYTSVIKPTSTISKGGYHSSKELAGGMSFSQNTAILKAAGEAIERYCLSTYQEQDLVYGSQESLSSIALNINSVTSFSKTQLQNKIIKDTSMFKLEKKLWWTKGHSFITGKTIFIPAQLVYMPYYLNNEPLIRLPITTGAAAGTSLSGAIERGINEVVERDAFMIFYLNKMIPPVLSLSSSNDPEISKLSRTFKRYNLELYVFDITTDIPITSIMAIIVDRTSFGPAISVGLKASLNSKSAVIGAIEEAQHTRPWVRDAMLINGPRTVDNDEIDLLDRGLVWADKKMINKLDFFLKSKKSIPADRILLKKKITKNRRLTYLKSIFGKMNMEVGFVDVTPKMVKKSGFVVVKVIIPSLQPLHLVEEMKYLGGVRLYQVPVKMGYKEKIPMESQLNQVPHPFL